MIVNLPISGSSTSNLIIEILLSASNGRPGREPGFPDRSSRASIENPFFQSPQDKDSACTVPIGAGFSFFWSGREPNRNDLGVWAFGCAT
jgi:hypothetical protein